MVAGMTKRRKPSHRQKIEQRLARRPKIIDAPPPEAIAAYTEVFEWADNNPGQASQLMAWDDEVIQSIVSGVAYPQRFNITDEQITDAVWKIRAWHILNGYKFFYDWWTTPIAVMTNEEIIAQINQDRDNGLIVVLSDESGQPVD